MGDESVSTEKQLQGSESEAPIVALCFCLLDFFIAAAVLVVAA